MPDSLPAIFLNLFYKIRSNQNEGVLPVCPKIIIKFLAFRKTPVKRRLKRLIAN
jgi:hypothetical protein